MDVMSDDAPRTHRASKQRATASFRHSMLLTVASAIVPGSGLIAVRRRVVGGIFLVLGLAVIGFAIWAATAGQTTVLHWAVEPGALVWISVGIIAVGLLWVSSMVTTQISTAPRPLRSSQRVAGVALVGVLGFAVMAPMVVAAQYATTTRDLVNTVFASDTARSATVDPQKVTTADPWQGKNRVNILLLGGDGGADRTGVRTDTMILASIDTRTGNTVLLSLPRNLMRVPLPPDTALSKAYGGTFYGPGPEGNWMLNAMYLEVPQNHPEVYKTSDHPAADVMKMTIGYVLGVKVDYFALVNLSGFKKLVDALGGITVNINYPIPVGGDTDANIAPDRYLQPGKDVHLDGGDALWYARGRYHVVGGDYARMDRQRCFISAVVSQADPARVLTRYKQLAATSKEIVSTDIPSKLLPALVDLAMKIKDAKVTSAVFDSSVTYYAHPDYAKIKRLALAAIAKSEATKVPAKATSTPTTKKATSTATAAPGTATDVKDACAYNPDPALN
jgi:LCP family protein required for cell wall assembly